MTIKITSEISIVLKQLTGEDIIAFADELKTRRAEKDPVSIDISCQSPDRGGFGNEHTITLKHTTATTPGLRAAARSQLNDR